MYVCLLFFSSLLTLSRGLDLHVDCLNPTSPLPTLSSAQGTLQALFHAFDSKALPRPEVNVYVAGPCAAPSQPFNSLHSGKVTWLPSPPSTTLEITGGRSITYDLFSKVTDPAILSQLPPISHPYVLQLNLTAASLDPGPAPISGRRCRSYAEGLPQPHSGGMPGGEINSPTGMEFFFQNEGGVVTPLTLAAYPNQPSLPSGWSHVLHSTTQGPFNRTMGPDLPTLARAQAWIQQFHEDPASIYIHEYNRLGWADMHWVLEGVTASNMTFGGCGNMSVGEHYIQTGNYFYAYNVAAELDREGEYYINRTSQMLYAWLPPRGGNATGSDVAGFVSLVETPLLPLDSVEGHTFVNVSLKFGRGVGLSCTNCSSVSVNGGEVAYVGLMGVNVSEGVGVSLATLSVHDTGNGGVYLYGGDRVTLTPGRHTLTGTTITRYNRYTHCYTPGVVFGGVGNRVSGATIWDAPHQAVYLSGNEHTLEDCDVSLVTQITMDSGAFYAGRDVTYRGNKIHRCAWHDLNSANPGCPALYLDDCFSSVEVINNTFRNCSGPAAASEGGKGHTFIGNHVAEDALGVHAVGKNCAGALAFLPAVPWNTSEVWLRAYPELVGELTGSASGDPWHLTFLNNSRCTPTANQSSASPFVDMAPASVAKYNGTSDGGFLSCPPLGPPFLPPPPTVSPPVRGWNSWTAYGCGVSDADLRATADALVDKGLAKAGYTIVAPDDCVMSGREAGTGALIPDPATFPNGVAPVADYIRSKGLTFGMYTAIGNTTCAHRPGGAGHEMLDAATYAQWGVTWLKDDNCNYPGWDPADLYARWKVALDALPYRITMAVKAVVNYTTALAVGAGSRRVGWDVSANFNDLLGLAAMAEPLWPQAHPGSYATGTPSFWTDVELLQVGNGGLTQDQECAHFWLWCALHAPLILSTKVPNLTPAQVTILTNPEALAINGDPGTSPQARRVEFSSVEWDPLTPARTPTLSPRTYACSLPDSPAPAQGQAWVYESVGGGASSSSSFRLHLAHNTSLCLLRTQCSGSGGEVLGMGLCSEACEGGLGATWKWGGEGSSSTPSQITSLSSGGGCLTLEPPRVMLQKCGSSSPTPPPYQTLSYNPGTRQLAMNFTGSGAQGDYTGYPQCLEVPLRVSGEVWAGNLSDGGLSILVLNPTAVAGSLTLDIPSIAKAVGWVKKVGELKAVRDVGERVTLSNASNTFPVSVNATAARFLRVTPA